MIGRLSRLMLVLVMPLVLTGCLLAPGKFVSKLTINADRTFSFSYVGEVIAVDLSETMGKGLGGMVSPGDDDALSPGDSGYDDGVPVLQRIALKDDKDAPAATGQDKAETEAKNRAVAEALSNEAGYRKVTYEGDGRFLIDYAISGTLTHGFVWPFNIDAEIVFPFVAVELRGGGTVRVKAPAFANETGKSTGMGGADQMASKLDGTFTLDTDAEIVSQNEEGGAVTAGGRRTVTWKATPLSKSAPMAVLRMK